LLYDHALYRKNQFSRFGIGWYLRIIFRCY